VRIPIIVCAALVVVASVAPTARGQDMYTNAKKKATAAKNAENAHIEAEQHPEGPQKPAPKPQAAAPAPASASQKVAAKPAPATTVVGKGARAKADTVPPPSIMREEYVYAREARRDPFVSLLTTNELRPTLSDLRVTGILVDHSGRNSIATLRDLTNNNQYRVTNGSALGRMRVTAIKTNTVLFMIEEFGTTRIDSLLLRDTTKARAK
jgi:hypothetical protein